MTPGSYLCWLNPSIKKMSKSTVYLVKYLILFGALNTLFNDYEAQCWLLEKTCLADHNFLQYNFVWLFWKRSIPVPWMVKSTKIGGWNIQFVPRCFMWNPLKSKFSVLKWLKSELSWAESTHFWILFHLVPCDSWYGAFLSHGGIPSHRGCFNTSRHCDPWLNWMMQRGIPMT